MDSSVGSIFMKLKIPVSVGGKIVPGMFDLVEMPDSSIKTKRIADCLLFGDKLPLPRVPCIDGCNNNTLLDIYSCPIHNKCTPRKRAEGIQCCTYCPDKKHMVLPMKWAYGVTTVPSRKNDLLPQTLSSLKAAGFDSPRLFVDGDNNHTYYQDRFHLEVTCRHPTIRAYGNWMLSLLELYIREPTADRFALFQDDLIAYKNLRQFLEKSKYPDKSYLNLYLFPSNQRDQLGWYEGRLLNSGPEGYQTGRGAVALIFNRDAVQTILEHRRMIEAPTHVDNGGKRIDGGVVTAMNKAGFREYVHNPSLVQHTGEISTVGNAKHPTAATFRGEQFDALDLLKR